MAPMRKTALAAGLLYLATFVFSIPALGFYDGVLNNPDFVLGAGSDSGVLWGGLFEIITALTGIGTAVVLYPVIKRHGPTGAIGFVASRTLEAAMIFVGVISVLAVVHPPPGLRRHRRRPALTTTADALVAIKDWTFLLGPGVMPAINALCLATVLYRSRLVPRIIPTIGLIGAPLLLASVVATLFGAWEQVSATGPGLRPADRRLGVLPRRLDDRQGLQVPSRSPTGAGIDRPRLRPRHGPERRHTPTVRGRAAAFGRRRTRVSPRHRLAPQVMLSRARRTACIRACGARSVRSSSRAVGMLRRKSTAKTVSSMETRQGKGTSSGSPPSSGATSTRSAARLKRALETTSTRRRRSSFRSAR